ncbi:MAG: tetratricopeptide repeat protein [Candidatus Kuenenia sp.]|nr:tetratricopeptide repeat protein [Candidatus Kuenenia hertensis]
MKNAIVEEEQKESKSDIKLRRNIDEWTLQLYSDDPTIRSSAAVSLLGLNLQSAQEPLISILKDSKVREDVKISVIKAFGFARDDCAVEHLIQPLGSESEPVKTAAVNALGRIKTKKSINLMANAMLSPKQPNEVKILLAKALGNTNDQDAVESLIKMLRADDRDLRETVMTSLEKITKVSNNNDSSWWKEWWLRNKSKTREQWLEEIVLKQEEKTQQLEGRIEQLKEEVAQKSIKLIELGYDKIDPTLLSEAIKSDYPEVRIFAAKELAKIKESSTIEILIKAISDKEEEVRIEVVQALGEIGDEKAIKPLIHALNDENLVVREKAAKALGQLGNNEAVTVLIEALNKKTNFPIVCSIIESLGKIGDLRAVDTLINFLSHEKSEIRECTAASLGKLGDARAVEHLIAALNDEEERVRWYAADSLGKIGNPICVESLIKRLSDNSARVRESAVTALGQIGNQQAIEALIKALQDVDKRVVDQAAERLVNIEDATFDIMDSVATTFYNSADYKRAEIVLNRIITKYAKFPELQDKVLQIKIKLAKTLFALKDWQNALNVYEEVLKRYTNDDTIKKELIHCIKELKQFDRALKWFAAWLEENPQNYQLCWQGRLDIASAMFDQGKYENVKDLINVLKTEDPNLGGEEFKSHFQTLNDLCRNSITNSKG